MNDFKRWKNLHQSEQLEEFSSDSTGLLWLKIKSIIRKELISEFTEKNQILLNETALAKQFVELFELLREDLVESHAILDSYILSKNKSQLEELDVDQLVS